jgi:hypothetical protein
MENTYAYESKDALLKRLPFNIVEPLIVQKYADGEWREHPDTKVHEFWVLQQTFGSWS